MRKLYFQIYLGVVASLVLLVVLVLSGIGLKRK